MKSYSIPKFSTVFQNLGKMAVAVLDMPPFPADIAGRTIEEFVEVYRKSEGLKAHRNRKSVR
ncbi:Uncharacterised protein [[Flavobacterium] thermophilum]|nr:Uncharacterised protein [[Flavobacterium] thermophilum]